MAIRSYWETLFDPRFIFDRDWKQRRDIENQGEELRQTADTLEVMNQQLRQQVHDLSVTVMSLVEMLAEAGQIETQELKARVQAAMIGERHATRETTPGAPSLEVAQSAWDGLQKK